MDNNYIPRTLVVYEGLYENINIDVNIIAKQLSQAQVVILTHIATIPPVKLPNPCVCEDVGYTNIGLLIKLLKQLNSEIILFGYVPGTADAPYNSDCGNIPDNSWYCPNGECSNVVTWVDLWLQYPLIDGIMLDLIAPSYMNAEVRDNIFSYVKKCNKRIMANTPIYGENVEFACESSYFSEGDYVLVEGFCYANGDNHLDDGINAIMELSYYRDKGIQFAGLVTEKWATYAGETVDPNSSNFSNAKTVFNNYYKTGDVLQYTTSDLGIVSGTFQIIDPSLDEIIHIPQDVWKYI